MTSLDHALRAIGRRLLIAVTASSLCYVFADSRGVRPVSANRPAGAAAFDPTQSAALFVGIRRFPYDQTLAEVRYAVDDAIDLASALALDERARLIDPSHVILALSGEPLKPDSRRNLGRLVSAGARVSTAGDADILNALDEQARVAGKKGILILAFATHGYSRQGSQYLLTATSILRHTESAISESEIRDIASQSDAARSLILIDACRERLTEDRRSGGPDARSAARLLHAMDGVHGQVVLSAAAAGQYAYDDDDRRNGVFTAAVIDGLRCQASPDERGLITIDTLSSFVEQHVLTWIRKHRDPRATHATQLICEGAAKTMPLAECYRITSSGATPAIEADSHPINEARTPSLALTAFTRPTESIGIAVFDDAGVPLPQLAVAGIDAIRESGYHPLSLSRVSVWDEGLLQQLAAGRGESIDLTHLSRVCRAVFAGTVARSTAKEKDPVLHGVIATRLRLRFYLVDSGSGTVLSSIDYEVRGGGFSNESSEIQAWERASASLRQEMRKMKWAELLPAR